MSKKIAILQSNYIPWRGYFDLLNSVDEFILYDEVQYTKNDWRNRNKIKTTAGVIWLTIPVSASTNMKISDVKVSNKYWQKKHYKSIAESYSKAPFFKQILPYLENLYLDNDYNSLSEVNVNFLKFINAFIGIETKITLSSNFLRTTEDRNQRLVDLVKGVKGSTYLTGPSALSYLDISKFKDNGLSVECINYSSYSDYYQLHGSFDPSVSMIDTIMMLGTDSILTLSGDSYAIEP